jgi:hypothetical protein
MRRLLKHVKDPLLAERLRHVIDLVAALRDAEARVAALATCLPDDGPAALRAGPDVARPRASRRAGRAAPTNVRASASRRR